MKSYDDLYGYCQANSLRFWHEVYDARLLWLEKNVPQIARLLKSNIGPKTSPNQRLRIIREAWERGFCRSMGLDSHQATDQAIGLYFKNRGISPDNGKKRSL